jgi:hypothetical protein
VRLLIPLASLRIIYITFFLRSGGGTRDNTKLNNATVPVLWMGNEALFAGLKLSESRVEWNWEELQKTTPTESLKYIWHLFELLPIKRLSYDKQGNTW